MIDRAPDAPPLPPRLRRRSGGDDAIERRFLACLLDGIDAELFALRPMAHGRRRLPAGLLRQVARAADALRWAAALATNGSLHPR